MVVLIVNFNANLNVKYVTKGYANSVKLDINIISLIGVVNQFVGMNYLWDLKYVTMESNPYLAAKIVGIIVQIYAQIVFKDYALNALKDMF